MTKSQKMVAPFVFVLASSLAALGQDKDVQGSKDHPLVSRYPGLVIRKYVVKEFDEYVFPLGRLRGDYKIEKSQTIEGKVTRISYESPAGWGRSVLEVYRNYEGALKRVGFEPLFSCSAEACGHGAFRFSPDEDRGWGGTTQRHLSAKWSRPEGDVYASLHVEEHGRPGGPMVAVRLHIIEMKPMEAGLVTVDAAALAGDISRTGHVAVYGIYFDTGKADVKPESEAALKEIAKLLQQDPNLKLYVIGHTDSAGDLAMNADLSRRRAAAVVQALTTKHGIAAARLRPDGVGPYAPVASNDTEDGRAKNRRVELVKQ